MKTIKEIRTQLGLTHIDIARYLEMTEDNIIQIENSCGKLKGKALAALHQLESWLNSKPEEGNGSPPSSLIDHCNEKLAAARHKKYLLENQLSSMEKRYELLDAEHTQAIKLCMYHCLGEYYHASVMFRRLKLEYQMTRCCGEQQSGLRMKIFLISEEIKSLTRYLEAKSNL
jgi:transcriptional regulator with XRE-family HTH domain